MYVLCKQSCFFRVLVRDHTTFSPAVDAQGRADDNSENNESPDRSSSSDGDGEFDRRGYERECTRMGVWTGRWLPRNVRGTGGKK